MHASIILFRSRRLAIYLTHYCAQRAAQINVRKMGQAMSDEQPTHRSKDELLQDLVSSARCWRSLSFSRLRLTVSKRNRQCDSKRNASLLLNSTRSKMSSRRWPTTRPTSRTSRKIPLPAIWRYLTSSTRHRFYSR